ncbi:MAG: hypothetical protein E6G92_05210 [Alphaproteobacteria bacterium]|nr:MAG: hypothetical protein E6G92_05210 [Alphaproteobacteria bacterium]
MGGGPAAWVSKVLAEDDFATTQLGSNLIEIERTPQSTFQLGVISSVRVGHQDVAQFLDGSSDPSFVVNIPREAIWTGEAIEALQNANIAFGGMGDIHRAICETDPRTYVFREYAYVERRLRQHRSVTHITRLFDRVWRVQRGRGDVLDIAISNEYDLTADEVRTLWDRYGSFDALFHTNNLGRITTQAREAARDLEVELVESRGLSDLLRR